jgi:hypothetical protein
MPCRGLWLCLGTCAEQGIEQDTQCARQPSVRYSCVAPSQLCRTAVENNPPPSFPVLTLLHTRAT